MVLLWDPTESGDQGGREIYSYQMKVGCVGGGGVCVHSSLDSTGKYKSFASASGQTTTQFIHFQPQLATLTSPQAFGGSGSYQWSLAEKNGVIAVNSGGVVTALMQGSSSVQATDQKNALHFATTKVGHGKE